MNALISDARPLNYNPCRYAGSTAHFRGPQRALSGDYIACIGGTETFGKFIETPYPALIERITGRTSINLGCLHAGIDAFIRQPRLLDICTNAHTTVIQVMGATNMSNRHYAVDPLRNDRFLRASKPLKAIYPEVNFSQFERIDQMLTVLARISPARLHEVRREVQTAWVARMRSLINTIGGRIVLLWMADHAPYSNAQGGTICRDPMFVDRAMLNAIAAPNTHLIEIVVPPEDIARGMQTTVFEHTEDPTAFAMLGPVAHHRAADQLAQVLVDAIEPDEIFNIFAKD